MGRRFTAADIARAFDVPVSLVQMPRSPTTGNGGAGPRPRPKGLGGMNKTEAAYAAQELEPRILIGELLGYRFEGVKLRIARGTFYTPDFFVVHRDRFECHEVKGGHWEDDARVKIKAVATLYPWFRFVAVTRRRKRDGGGWAQEEFAPW